MPLPDFGFLLFRLRLVLGLAGWARFSHARGLELSLSWPEDGMDGSLPPTHHHLLTPFPTSSVAVCPSPYPKFFISSTAIRPLSMRQLK